MYITDAKIYKIYSTRGELNSPDTYVGSTCKYYLEARLNKHKSDYLKWEQGIKKDTYTIFKLFDKYPLETFVISLIKKIDVETKQEVLEIEKHYINSISCVNKNMKPPVARADTRNQKPFVCGCGVNICRERDRKKHEATRNHISWISRNPICTQKFFQHNLRLPA